jgi:hypothetical protein
MRDMRSIVKTALDFIVFCTFLMSPIRAAYFAHRNLIVLIILFLPLKREIADPSGRAV